MTKILIEEATVKMALEALEGMAQDLGKFPGEVPAIVALREARADQPAMQQELTKAMIDAAERIDWADSDVRGNIVNMWQAMCSAAEQPAPVRQEPVALDVTLEGEEAQALYDLLGDDREDLSPLRLLVGDGHSGYGLYVALAEYQDEGAELIASINPPAPQPAPVQQEPCAYIPADALEQVKPPRLILRNVPIYGYHADGTVGVYTSTPPQRKPLTVDEAISAVSSVLPVTSTGGQTHHWQIQYKYALEIARAIEAAHGINE